MEVKFGILGYGFMGHNHVKTVLKLQEAGRAKLIAICDHDLKRFADAPEGIKQYHSMDEMFKDDEINTVIIAINNHVHKEAVIKAARAGKHILCEKPVAMSVEDFDEMMSVVEECNVKFTVHQQRRWDKDFRIMKDSYDKQQVGDVYTVQSKLYGINGNMHDWHVYKKYGGGMLYDWGVHLIDQMLWMIDSKITSVFADLRNVINFEVDDYFKILLRFENNIIGEIELGTYFLEDKENWFERHWFIGGNKGSAYADGFFPQGKLCTTTRLLQNVPGKITMSAAGPTRSFGPPQPGVLLTEDLPDQDVNHDMFFDNFLEALNGNEEFIVTKEQVRRVLCLMEAVRKSAELGQSVPFES